MFHLVKFIGEELETMVNTCRTVSVISYCSQKSEQEQSEPINQSFDDVLELSKDFEFENNDILLQPSVNCPGSVDSVMGSLPVKNVLTLS